MVSAHCPIGKTTVAMDEGYALSAVMFTWVVRLKITTTKWWRCGKFPSNLIVETYRRDQKDTLRYFLVSQRVATACDQHIRTLWVCGYFILLSLSCVQTPAELCCYFRKSAMKQLKYGKRLHYPLKVLTKLNGNNDRCDELTCLKILKHGSVVSCIHFLHWCQLLVLQ